MTLDELKEQLNAIERQANLQQAMEQYAELIADVLITLIN